MFLRQIALVTALYAIIALMGAAARVPDLDAGIRDWAKESTSAYGTEPEVIALIEEGIVL